MPNVTGLVLHTYLNLISLLRLSITVAPPKECPITAILLVSTESCQKNPGAVRDFLSQIYFFKGNNIFRH